MYQDFYGLTEKPFSILPDPDYLFFGERHAMAYTMLEYGIEHGDGFTVITGDVGCGKTTLVRRLLNESLRDITVGLVSNIQDGEDDLMKWVLLAFDQPFDGIDRVALFRQFQDYLIDQYRAGKRTVLIIDEAQNLSKHTLEELRMLSNINADKHHLLQLVLFGQPQFKALLRTADMEQFVQRMSSDFHIGPLAADEVPAYIEHRVSVAGGRQPLFDDGAVLAIAKASGGVPRRINVLADMALVYGFSQQVPLITADIVHEVLRDKSRYGVASERRSERPAAVVRAKPKPVARNTMKQSDLDIARELFSSRVK